MKILKKILVALGIAVAADATAAVNPGEPDFSHPRQVLQQAYGVLSSTAGDPGAGPKRVKALLEICTAAQSIDPDSVFSLVGLCDDLSAQEKTPAAASLMKLVGAKMLMEAYESKRYVYDRLSTPDEPLPADIREWNGRQFKAGMVARLKESLALANATSVPLADYAAAVNADEQTLLYFPTVAAFVACDAVDMYDEIDERPLADELYISMRDSSPQGSPAYYYWAVSQITHGLQDGNAEVKRLYDFYIAHMGDEYARMALVDLADTVSRGGFVEDEDEEDDTESSKCVDDNADKDKITGAVVADLIERSLEKFPGYWDNASLRNNLARLRRGRVTIGYPTLVCPGRPFDVMVDARYVAQAGAKVYKLTNGVLSYRVPFKSLEFVRGLKYTQDADIAQTIYNESITLDSPGAYAIVPVADGHMEDEKYFYAGNMILATPYVPLYFSRTKEQVVAIADFVTGKPASDVKVLVYPENYSTRKEFVTDKNGLARIEVPENNWGRLSVITPSGRELGFGVAFSLYSSPTGKRNNNTNFSAAILPDRPIYHPGDSVHWAAIVDYSNDGRMSRHASENLEVEVDFLDANGQNLKSEKYHTDIYGRVYGAFDIPQEGLTGNYTVLVKIGDREEGRTSVMVSDYRMPTFEIKDVEVQRGIAGSKDVLLRGRAVTYSGMPVADAQVTADINNAFRWRWWQPMGYVGSVGGRTAENGTFEIAIPDSLLSTASSHDFLAQIKATAPTGETATSSRSFTTGKKYVIEIAGTERFVRAETRTVLPVAVYDAQGKKCGIEIKWKLVDEKGGKAVASGTCSSLDPIADFERVRGGYYKLVVEAADNSLADKVESQVLTFYNVELNSLPSNMPLLVADTEVVSDDAGHAAFRYGVGHDDTWLYAALCVGDKIVEVEVQKRNKGFRYMSLDLPDGADQGALEIATVVNGKTTNYRVEIKRPKRPQLQIEGSSFRDKMIPGSHEQWHLTVKGAESNRAAMVATMYNHALDALHQLWWPAGFALSASYPRMRLETLASGTHTDSEETELKYLEEKSLSTPSFKYLISNRIMVAYGVTPRAMLMSRSADNMMMEKCATVNTEAGAYCDDIEEADTEEKQDGGQEPQREFSYRDAEVAQAFWMPSVATDEDGNVTLDFIVPDANTTWRFHALAWSREMEAGSIIRDIVANKPVMVQPNLPRFLRQGDKARLLATIYNNKEEESDITATVELFNPSTMQVTATAESTQRVAAGASAVVAIDVEAPFDAIAVGYRVRCTDGTFSDGEQALVPVESAECDVVESTPFYLNPGDKSLSIHIPSDPNGTYTLQYCMNPSWSIVKALPGLVTYDATTATEAVHTLFAACTSAGIVKRNPAVADALKAWKDKAPVSRLAQNDALKTVALNATPWVQAAQSDTERMARLSLLLDSSNAADQIAAAIKLLGKLADKDGGLRWGPWSRESSQWATSMALHDLGLLRMAGDLPADEALDRMMRDALKYLDRELEKDCDGKVEPSMAYAVVRSMWKDVQPSAFGSKVIEATLRDCAAGWRKVSTSRKANMAILLSLYGRNDEAAAIISSVSEFAVKSPSQGVSFPSVADIEQYAPMLMAFGRVDPSSVLIDGMRQWLVVREQATVGLGASDATQLVGAFISSGTPWHTDNAPATVTLKGKPVHLGDACSYGGEATVPLGREAAGKTLTVAPAASVPSYGAVISSYRTLPGLVKAVDCDGLSIEKRMMLVGADGSTTYTDEMPLGSRVRVLLTLHVGRDMQYVNIVDNRAAALEPMVQTPGMTESGGAYFYRENRDASTRLFISYLPKGTYQISYDCTAAVAGSFAGGLATVQSALAPSLTAHSAGSALEVR